MNNSFYMIDICISVYLHYTALNFQQLFVIFFNQKETLFTKYLHTVLHFSFQPELWASQNDRAFRRSR